MYIIDHWTLSYSTFLTSCAPRPPRPLALLCAPSQCAMAIVECTESNDRSGRSVPGKHDACPARRPVPASACANPLHPLPLRRWLCRLPRCSQHQTTRFPLRELENDHVKLTPPALHASTQPSTATHPHPHEHTIGLAREHGSQLEGIVRWQRVLPGHRRRREDIPRSCRCAGTTGSRRTSPCT